MNKTLIKPIHLIFQYMSCFSFTYIVIHSENEMYLKKNCKYFPVYLYLNTFVFRVLSQHVLEPTMGKNVIDIALTSQKECIDNGKIRMPLGCIVHNQVHFIIKVKPERYQQIRHRNYLYKGKYHSVF